jgi:hypothetical protein
VRGPTTTESGPVLQQTRRRCKSLDRTKHSQRKWTRPRGPVKGEKRDGTRNVPKRQGTKKSKGKKKGKSKNNDTAKRVATGAAGGAAAGGLLWWLGKAASPLCGPAAPVCLVVL